jgi:hypothetical protein
MPKPKKYWGVEKNLNRHRRVRWYFRPERDEPRIRLPDDFGGAEFEAAWRAAIAGQPLPASPSLPRQGRRASRGSLGWLVSLHLASPAFLDNRASTQRPRRTMLEKLAVAHGSTDIEDITRLGDVRDGRQVHEEVQPRESVDQGNGRLRSRRCVYPHPRFGWGKGCLNAKEINGLIFSHKSFSESGLFNDLRPIQTKRNFLFYPRLHVKRPSGFQPRQRLSLVLSLAHGLRSPVESVIAEHDNARFCFRQENVGQSLRASRAAVFFLAYVRGR